MIENPHEQRQTLLLSRIIKNVDLLNESLEELSRSLAEINVYNEGNAEVADMWENYRRSAAFNLEALDADSQQQQQRS
ncbi:DASH complex, subunit Dad4 [Jaminaea rosea]|uniref:DASH complex subunit DAD4 n=1 Tax=Jaminaea rosea TaxID=1569628 RepID=A0A316UMH3_9BASI|nr:DASH complex, subunit Dad4 [Jaminaea rosea]PWN24375.1 DASH complex, subunit Dad4 [Jaminaea rosea]